MHSSSGPWYTSEATASGSVISTLYSETSQPLSDAGTSGDVKMVSSLSTLSTVSGFLFLFKFVLFLQLCVCVPARMCVLGTEPGSPALAASAGLATGPFPQPEVFGFQLTELHLIFYQYFSKYVGGVSFECFYLKLLSVLCFYSKRSLPVKEMKKLLNDPSHPKQGSLNRFGHTKKE